MLKKLTTLTIAAIVAISTLVTPVTFAANADVTVELMGKVLDFPADMGKPFISSESRTMIPLRAVSEKMGFEVSWNQAENSATVKGKGIQIVLPIGKNYGMVNGKKVDFDTYTITKGGRTYVPLRFVSETLGYDVKWEWRSGNYVIISTKTDSSASAKVDLAEKYSEFGVVTEDSDKDGNFFIGGHWFKYDAESVLNTTPEVEITNFDGVWKLQLYSVPVTEVKKNFIKDVAKNSIASQKVLDEVVRMIDATKNVESKLLGSDDKIIKHDLAKYTGTKTVDGYTIKVWTDGFTFLSVSKVK